MASGVSDGQYQTPRDRGNFSLVDVGSSLLQIKCTFSEKVFNLISLFINQQHKQYCIGQILIITMTGFLFVVTYKQKKKERKFVHYTFCRILEFFMTVSVTILVTIL
jgi:uncharacterized protein Veg